METPDQLQLRSAAIAFVRALSERYAAVPRSELVQFRFRGQPVHLSSQQGIFKPKELELPLSIRTAIGSPYADETVDGERVRYNYAVPSREYDNDGLKRCRDFGVPLIYFHQVKAKPNPEFYIFAPVFIAGWDDVTRTFVVDLSERMTVEMDTIVAERPEVTYLAHLQKGYVETRVERRLHQARFRNEILRAYRDRCAVCVLRLRPLLDAAHVVPDTAPTSLLTTNDGLALCALHHRAFDARILSYDDRYRVRIELPRGSHRGDGEQSMLLQFDGRPLTLPGNEALWPLSRSALETRSIQSSGVHGSSET